MTVTRSRRKEIGMSASVLVTYATRYGSTQEVAEAVAEALRAGRLEVDLVPAGKVGSLDGYRAVVLGAPLYIGRLPKDAQRFLSRHRQALTARPVAPFVLGPTNDEEQDWENVRAQLDKELARYPWLAPLACELFGGRMDPAKLRFPESLLVTLPASPLHGMPASDARDWDAIRAWAANLPAQLVPSSPQ
jgi:menaquinone-dependent protoporphyrinogen oxidase